MKCDVGPHLSYTTHNIDGHYMSPLVIKKQVIKENKTEKK